MIRPPCLLRASPRFHSAADARSHGKPPVDRQDRLVVSLLSVALLVSSAARAQTFRADYSGANEVPPNASTATGVGIFTLDASGLLYYRIQHNVINETAAHIHGPALPGVNAGVQFALPSGGLTPFFGPSLMTGSPS